MSENIKYLEIPPVIEGKKSILFYSTDCLPSGMTVEDISNLKESGYKIPYVECKSGSIPVPMFLYVDLEDADI